MQKKVAIFCASSHQIDDLYIQHAKKLATLLVENKYHILYGGGGKGLMGTIANEVLRSKGNITGIIPHFMVELEWQHPFVDDMVLVESMAERKKLLTTDIEGVIVLPGGIGTFEEALEVLSMKKLGAFFAPIIFLNTKNYYDPLLELLQKASDEKFMRKVHQELWDVAKMPEDVIMYLNQNRSWPKNSIEFADMP